MKIRKYSDVIDKELANKMDEFKERLNNGETTDDIPPEFVAVKLEESGRLLLKIIQ